MNVKTTRRAFLLRHAVLGAAAALSPPRIARALAQLDQPAPSLRGKLLDGSAFDLAAMKGKVVLVNFYSSFCKYCAYEIGNIETYYEENKSKGFEVIAIGVDRIEDKARVARQLGIYNLPGAMLQELELNEFGSSYPTPTCFVIDRQGIVRHRQWGAKTLPLLARLTGDLLRTP
jgi:cytochrome c biogenesis protein CcmG, thiol:disulfide interchange protein DsbE